MENIPGQFIFSPRILDHLGISAYNSVRKCLAELAISDEPEAGSVEVSPNITAELNAKGELIGIEILGASTFIRDSVLESVQARVLDLAQAKTA
jgi:uncharacterized protein YuzE